MGSRDALRNRDLRISAASDDEPLPMSEHARERHRSLSDIQQLKNFVAGDPGRLRQLIRAPFEVEPGETANLTTMRMPPFMRQSNAMPLTLTVWQYDLLMRWVAQVQAPAAPALAPGVPRALSEGATRRREHVLRSMGREPSP
jgi:hypothetical protein